MRLAGVTLLTFLCFVFFEESKATIDLSNVDLTKFEYFKNKIENNVMAKAQQTMQLLAPITDKITNKITDKVEKTKAVVTYFRNVILGNPELEKPQAVTFDPGYGEPAKTHYQQYYGPKGMYLVDALGKGYSPQQYPQYIADQKKMSGYYY